MEEIDWDLCEYTQISTFHPQEFPPPYWGGDTITARGGEVW